MREGERKGGRKRRREGGRGRGRERGREGGGLYVCVSVMNKYSILFGAGVSADVKMVGLGG